MRKTFSKVVLIVILLAGSFLHVNALDIPEADTDLVYVQDFAKVINDSTIDYIVEKNKILDEKTGAQIVVATVNTTGTADIEDYAYAMFNQYGIGSSSKDNGVFLLLVIAQEDYWMMAGSGLESHYSGGAIKNLLWDYLEDDFADGDYDAGVRSWFDAVYRDLSDYYNISSSTTPSSPMMPDNHTDSYSSVLGSIFSTFLTIAFLIIVLIIVVSILTSRRSTRYRAPRYQSPNYRVYRPITFRTPDYYRPRDTYSPRPDHDSHSSSWNFGGGSSSHRSSSSSSRSSFGGGSSSRSSSSSSRSSFGGGSSRGGGAGRK